MNQHKIAGENDIIAGWTEPEVNKLELFFLHNMFKCDVPEGVDVTMTFARFMSRVKIDSDNYPVFLKILEMENHWVVDALLGDKEPEKFFNSIQPNKFILTECFRMFTRWKRGGIYSKSLLVLLGILKASYKNPHEGYRLFPIGVSDINNLAKHLDEEKDQKDLINRIILDIIDYIGTLSDPGSLPVTDPKIMTLATQANNIRSKFLDITKHLKEAIPEILLEKSDLKKIEVQPTITLGAASK